MNPTVNDNSSPFLFNIRRTISCCNVIPDNLPSLDSPEFKLSSIDVPVVPVVAMGSVKSIIAGSKPALIFKYSP
jgi:hypothetical protein